MSTRSDRYQHKAIVLWIHNKWLEVLTTCNTVGELRETYRQKDNVAYVDGIRRDDSFVFKDKSAIMFKQEVKP